MAAAAAARGDGGRDDCGVGATSNTDTPAGSISCPLPALSGLLPAASPTDIALFALPDRVAECSPSLTAERMGYRLTAPINETATDRE